MSGNSDAIFELSQAESSPEPTPAPAPEPTPVVASQEAPKIDPSSVDEGPASIEASQAEIEPVTEPTEDSELEQTNEQDQAEAEAIAEEIAYLEALDGNKYPETLTFKKKIDGELREVSLKDALAEFSGKYAVKERFAEANTMKQKAEHQARQIIKQEYELKQVSRRFTDAMSKGDTRSAVDALCAITGQDAEEVWGAVSQAQREAAQRLAQMTPEEWNQQTAKQEAEYWKNKHSSEADRRFEAELLDRKLEAQEKYGLEDNDLRTATEMLLDLQKKGAYTKEVTLNDVVETARDFKIYKSIDATVREVLPHKVGDDKFYQELLNDTKQYNMTKDDWIGLFNEIKSKAPKGDSKLGAKVAKNSSPTAPKKNAPVARKPLPDDYLDLVNLDDL